MNSTRVLCRHGRHVPGGECEAAIVWQYDDGTWPARPDVCKVEWVATRTDSADFPDSHAGDHMREAVTPDGRDE